MLHRIVKPLQLCAWMLAVTLFAGVSQAQDKATRQLANEGDAKAQFMLAEQYFHGREGLPRNQEEAFNWYMKAAKGGYMAAQFTLGTLYDTGEGVKRDLAQAFKWYKTVAEQGVGAAAYNIAVMYENGEGTKKDPVQAYVWYSIAGIFSYKDANPFAQALADTLPADDLVKADQSIIDTVNSINETMRNRLANEAEKAPAADTTKQSQ